MEASVRAHASVISASIPTRTPHLMLVVYDSDCASACQILGRVRDRGLHATMLYACVRQEPGQSLERRGLALKNKGVAAVKGLCDASIDAGATLFI